MTPRKLTLAQIMEAYLRQDIESPTMAWHCGCSEGGIRQIRTGHIYSEITDLLDPDTITPRGTLGPQPSANHLRRLRRGYAMGESWKYICQREPGVLISYKTAKHWILKASLYPGIPVPKRRVENPKMSGSANHMAILNEAQVWETIEAYQGGAEKWELCRDRAEMYKVSHRAIGTMLDRLTWKHVWAEWERLAAKDVNAGQLGGVSRT